MRSPVTAVIESFNALTEEQKKLCLDFIAPEPEPQLEVPAKKTRKKRAARSTHAESLSAAIAKTPKADVIGAGTPCAYQYPKAGEIKPGMICGCPADDTIHDQTFGYAGYHPFESTAPTATRRSSRKGAVTNSTVNSETSSEGALGVGAGGE